MPTPAFCLTSPPGPAIIQMYQEKCVYPGRVARHPSVQREQAIGWEPVCRPLCKVRPGSTLWENAVSQRGRPPLPALSDKPEWNRD